MPSRSISFADASQGLLDAAVDPSRWSSALDTIAQYADAKGALLLPIKGRMPGSPSSESLGEGLDEYFRDGWHERDERARGIPLGRATGIFTDQDIATADELRSSDYYQGLLAKHGCNWSADINFIDADDEWYLVIQRGNDKGFFDAREQADLKRFGTPMNQAAKLARSIGYANALGMLDAHQALNVASFLLDDQGYVIKFNAKAEALLGDGLELSQRTLRCAYPDDSLVLSRAVAALNRSVAPAQSGGPAVVVARRPLQRPLMIETIRLSGLAGALFSPARVMLIVADPGRAAAATPLDYAQKAFGLTLAEGRLVAHLERGLSLTNAADMMGVSVETARSHLKRVFAKTDTARQTDLMMLMSRLKPGH